MKKCVFAFMTHYREYTGDLYSDISELLDQSYPRIAIPMNYRTFLNKLESMSDEFVIDHNDWVYSDDPNNQQHIVIWTTTDAQAIELKLRITP